MLYPDFQELIELGRKTFQSFGMDSRRALTAAPGDYLSPLRGQGLDFEEVRRYFPGDDIRHIDWRVTARTDIPHLKVFTQERERTVILCIDASADMRFGTRGTFKSVQIARAASLLGWSANRSHDRIGAVVFGDVPGGMQFFAPTRSRRSLWKALKLLCEPQSSSSPTPSLEDMLMSVRKSAPTGALVFILSGFDRLTGSTEKALARLHRRCDIVLLRISDPADEMIPAMGMLRFADRGGKLQVDTDSVTGRTAYAAEYRQNRQALEEIAAKRQARLIDLRTNRDVRSDILAGLKRLSHGKEYIV